MHEAQPRLSGNASSPSKPARTVAKSTKPKSLADRLRRRDDWTWQPAERRRFVPCWLASLVVHLVLMIALASWLVPVNKDPFLHPLLLFFSNDTLPSPTIEDRPVLLARSKPEVGGEELSAKLPLLDPEAPVAEPLAPPLPAPVEDAPPVTAKVESPPAADRSTVQNTVAAKPADRPDLALRLANFSTGLHVPPELSAEVMEADPRQRRLDEVVDRFILFDIGQLGGAEGAEARRNFEKLGTEAIPALVRGLNKSASIHASCPVCVISNKLQSTLQRSHSQDLLRYTLANLGRGVPNDAPHWGRLVSLRRALTESADAVVAMLENPDPQIQLNGIEQVIQRRGAFNAVGKARLAQPLIGLLENGRPEMKLAAQRALALLAGSDPGAPAESLAISDPATAAEQWRTFWDRAEYIERFESVAPRVLAKAVEVGNAVERQAGAVAIADRAGKLTDGERLQLAHALLTLLKADDPIGRDCAQDALAALSRQQAPAEPWTAERWQEFWTVFQRESVIEPRARSYFNLARHLESRGQRKAAFDRYRKIIEEFPLSAAADQARQRLGQPAL